MTKVYLIRHAEAEGNVYRRVHGHYDSHLTPRGRKQIEALTERFKDVSIDAVYSSDLTRAIKTAEPIAQTHGLEVVTSKNLRECAHGIWEDVTWGDCEWIEPEQYNYYLNDPAKWKTTGSEGFYPLQRRITKKILDLSADNDGKTIVIVSHGYAIRAFMCGVYGYESNEISQLPHCDNAAVSYLEIEKSNIDLKYFGDCSHLDPSISTFAHQSWWKTNSSKDDRNLHFSTIAGSAFDIYEGYLKKWYEMCGEEVNDFVLKDAMMRSAFNPKSIVIGYIDQEPVGCIDMDGEKGCINFVYLDEQYRGKGLAVQLIGHAVNICRDAGCDKLTVQVPSNLTNAIQFFEADYYYVTEDDGNKVTLEKDLNL